MRALLLASCAALALAAQQPTWNRRDESGSKVHELLQRAAVSHQEGDLEAAAKALKGVLKVDKQNAEAYASLGKCYSDQGKPKEAEKAVAAARKINQEILASHSLF